MEYANSITTLLHLGAQKTPPSQFYRLVVILSTFVSFAWHYTGDERGLLQNLNYVLAALWFITDMHIGLHTIHFENILFWNMMTLILHHAMKGWMHAVWHVLSAMKCILVTKMLTGDV